MNFEGTKKQEEQNNDSVNPIKLIKRLNQTTSFNQINEIYEEIKEKDSGLYNKFVKMQPARYKNTLERYKSLQSISF
jgi:hypothetical protein